MSTKTMRLPPRRVLTPTETNKRKEREGFEIPKASAVAAKVPKQMHSQAAFDPPQNNRVLAGYLAREFLTQGTLFGKPYDPSRAGLVPPQPAPVSERAIKMKGAEPIGKGAEPKEEGKYQRYVEISSLLRTDGVHLSGIVNPTQLARYLQM